MKDFLLKYLLTGTLSLLITACGTIQYTSTKVQTLNPPTRQINLSSSANIAIVALWNTAGDSLDLTNTAMFLKENLEASPKYSAYVFPVYTIQSHEEMSNEQIDEIRATSDADYLIVLANLKIDVGKSKVSGALSGYVYGNESYSISTPAIYGVSFKIYDARQHTLLDSNQVNDTLNLVSKQYYWEVDEDVLPDRKTVVETVGRELTQNYAKRLAPYWMEETRYYYLQSEIERAREYIENEDWHNAMRVWMQHVDNSNKSLAAVCCFNMALGCEMLGEYDLALKWMENIKRKDEKYYWIEYKQTIEKRISEKKVIDKMIFD
ncbi:MAG: DUF6340 family protein [Prevotellaceae bacterium]|jgi:hypothetical protein|nr:DUF6340 family protein [Prevotellaceae bacterium]